MDSKPEATEAERSTGSLFVRIVQYVGSAILTLLALLLLFGVPGYLLFNVLID